MPEDFELDQDGVYSFCFGDASQRFELTLEPTGRDRFHLALYRYNMANKPIPLLKSKIPVTIEQSRELVKA